jgi:hypothetical protein
MLEVYVAKGIRNGKNIYTQHKTERKAAISYDNMLFIVGKPRVNFPID